MKEEPKIFFITTIGTAKTKRVSHPRLKPNGWIMIVQSILQVGVNSADSTELTGPVEYPILFNSRQVEKFNNYNNPSSTSKVIKKTRLNFWMDLFSICISFEFQANWVFR